MVWPTEFDDEVTVVEAVRSGDRYAFGELVRRHDRWVRSVVYGVLGDPDRVDDVAQQVWTTVWSRIRALRDVSRWRYWVYRLARNAAIDAGREKTRRRERPVARIEPGEADAVSEGGPEAGMLSLERRGEVQAAIEALPALYREPFVLRHVNGWSYREIAEVMNMPVDSIETRLVRARRMLKESLVKRLERS